jgi:hypothetical protein
MRAARTILVACLAACHRDEPRDYGRAPAADHQETVRTTMDGVLDQRYRLEEPSAYRFAAPEQDRVARWLFEGETEGRPQPFGYVYGWRVEFWVKPRYAGYPSQPEAHMMAFFVDGRLRGLFGEGTRNGPLELDKWSPSWVDPMWRPPQPAPSAGTR